MSCGHATAETRPVQRPRGARLTTLLLVGRISSGTRDDICRLRDISDSGMRIETLALLTVGQDVTIDFKNGTAIPAEVAWCTGGYAGLRFHEAVDIASVLVLAKVPQKRGPHVPRGPRFVARCAVALRCGGHILPGILENVSQGGAQLRWAGSAAIGDQVAVITPGLGTMRATVRRMAQGILGVALTDTLGFAELSEWLAGAERFSADTAIITPIRQSS